MSHLSYKRMQEVGQYDAIIIGSGIGSLVTGVALAKAGKRCLILERHYAPGGYTHTFKRKQYEWDVGVHYIGEVMRPQSMLSRLFRYINDGSLEWADMGEVYDRIRFGDEIFNFVKGRQAWTEQLKDYFPDQKDVVAIDQYVALGNQEDKDMFKKYLVLNLNHYFDEWESELSVDADNDESFLDSEEELSDF